jgi:phosphoribosylformylglycinamidine cyclo-ligase
VTGPPPRGPSYASAGVSIAEGERAVALMRAWVERATRPEVVGGIGGFAGLFDVSAVRSYRRPLLATSADGVGTKVVIAQRLGIHDTIGFDLVGMLVDDVVVCGAEPLYLTDYIACGKVVAERVASIVSGIAQACTVAGCALLGGETAEHPGLLEPDEFDLAGAATGVVDAPDLLGAERVQVGDAVVAMRSSGLHANGFALVRHVLLEKAGWTLERPLPECGRTLGEELLEPTVVYARAGLALARATGTRAMAHVTGGGIAANLARVVPDTATAVVNRATWQPAPIFDIVRRVGDIERAELEGTLNMGIGMLAVVDPDHVAQAVALLAEFGVGAWPCGEVVARRDDVATAGTARPTPARLVGRHR